jgi:hypothetical protein
MEDGCRPVFHRPSDKGISDMGFKFFVEHSRAMGSAKLAITFQDGVDGARTFVQPFTMKAFERHHAVPEAEAYALTDPFYDGNVRDFLQAAADAAWEIGIRPSQAKDMTSEVAAVRYHLEDMRKLALGCNDGAAK